MQTYFYEGPVCDLCKKIASACDCTARQNTMESPGTYKQHLQAEIAAFVTELEDHFRVCANDVKIPYVIDRMRQLSAVQ